jgi:hypothetical protein
MRSDGKAPTPPWLRGVDELAERVSHLEALVAKLVADAAPAPKAAAKSPPKVAPKAPEKKDATKKPAPNKAPARKK